MAVDMEKIGPVLDKMIQDLGPIYLGGLVILGDRLGLFRAFKDGPLTVKELADKTGTAERMVQEWMSSMAAADYLGYDAETETFTLSPEHEAIFTDENSPFYLMPAFEFAPTCYSELDYIEKSFQTGDGFAWGDHGVSCFCATAKFFRTTYMWNLVQEWIPALDGVQDKLKAGCQFADVGCGHGISTTLLAEAFPQSTFTGIDFHGPSLDAARQESEKRGLTNTSFVEATSKTFEGQYDVIALFDCFHDMGDPIGVARHLKESLTDGGTVFLVEPFANNTLAENLTPFSRFIYPISTMVCVPCAMSQNGSSVILGAQGGETRTGDCFRQAGFRSLERKAETPFNLIYQATP